MNIKISYKWLLEYLDTDASPFELQKYLSLCGPSVEHVTKVGDAERGGLTDYVLDIEITSNRIDMAAVMGIAREAQAILPQFGKKAKLKELKLSPPVKPVNELKISITDPSHTANRILGIVLDNITIGQSPDYIKKRLESAGIRALNNVVDITNYVMLEIGHPAHVFDYDRIHSNKLIFRKSKKGEKIISLEDKTYSLPGDDIVIEDGDGRIIDLPGIIGTSNSIVLPTTKRILFFIDNNDPVKMRRSSMKLGIRTVAATYNEKLPDPELGYTALLRGIQLYQKNAGARIASTIHDIYPHPRKEKSMKVYLKDIQRVMGVPIKENIITEILQRLGFKVLRHEDEELAYPDGVSFQVTVPTYRTDDISIKEDIIEEVARVYGYFNLPNNISPMVYIEQPKDIEKLFDVQRKIKYFLKNIGLHEVLNYSMISKELIEKMDLKLDNKLKIENTISEEIAFLRTSILPSLIKNIKENEGKRDILKFFEIAKVYEKKQSDLPNEIYRLGIAVNTSFADLKGIIEAILRDLNIKAYVTKKWVSQHFAKNLSAEILIADRSAVRFGQIKQSYQNNFEIKNKVYLAEFELNILLDNYKLVSPYVVPPQYALIKLDANIKSSKYNFDEIKKIAYKQSKLLHSIEYISSYKDTVTVRYYFTSAKENITEENAKKELEKILKVLV